jgi:hypothetical protein
MNYPVSLFLQKFRCATHKNEQRTAGSKYCWWGYGVHNLGIQIHSVSWRSLGGSRVKGVEHAQTFIGDFRQDRNDFACLTRSLLGNHEANGLFQSQSYLPSVSVTGPWCSSPLLHFYVIYNFVTRLHRWCIMIYTFVYQSWIESVK